MLPAIGIDAHFEMCSVINVSIVVRVSRRVTRQLAHDHDAGQLNITLI